MVTVPKTRTGCREDSTEAGLYIPKHGERRGRRPGDESPMTKFIRAQTEAVCPAPPYITALRAGRPSWVGQVGVMSIRWRCVRSAWDILGFLCGGRLPVVSRSLSSCPRWSDETPCATATGLPSQQRLVPADGRHVSLCLSPSLSLSARPRLSSFHRNQNQQTGDTLQPDKSKKKKRLR